ncbi:unnamed protein product [Blepharisma stoltei]|uniref:Uncharacterized protein n=1 Tax=Blepharisma stoltei TaxID=1481888 RepID=A0AAU9IWN7_9CILI|nr:unnamed protein product [Blepharisma stoltei]
MSGGNHELFSRAGKHSLEKFKILQERDAILSNKPQPKYRHMSKSSSAPSLSFVNTKKIVAEELEKLLKESSNQGTHKKHKKSPSAAFKSPERVHYSIFEGSKDETPATGCYEPSYSLVTKTPFSFTIPPIKRDHKFFSSSSPILETEEIKEEEDKKSKYPGVPFSKQSARKPFYDVVNGHEARFTVSNLSPAFNSKYKRQSFPDLNKYSERNLDKMFRIPKYLPEYSPNKEKILPKITRKIDFHRMSDREDLFDETLDIRTNCNVKYDLIEKKVISHDFKNDLPREKNPLSPLPSYIQSTMTYNELEKTCMHKKSCTSIISISKSPESNSINYESLPVSLR